MNYSNNLANIFASASLSYSDLSGLSVGDFWNQGTMCKCTWGTDWPASGPSWIAILNYFNPYSSSNFQVIKRADSNKSFSSSFVKSLTLATTHSGMTNTCPKVKGRRLTNESADLCLRKIFVIGILIDEKRK